MAVGFAQWFAAQRRRIGRIQPDLADKVDRNQTWVSQVETAQVRPNADEAAALAYFVGGSVLEALDQGGYPDEPPWVRRLEGKLDEIARALPSR